MAQPRARKAASRRGPCLHLRTTKCDRASGPRGQTSGRPATLRGLATLGLSAYVRTMKVVISGGGIAGLAVAGVLARHGHETVVYERRLRSETLGAGVICFANATLFLRRQGLETSVRAVSGTPRFMRRLSQAGEVLGELPIDAINQSIGAPSYSILRSDLHRILTNFALQQGARIEYGRQVRGVSASGALELDAGQEHAADWLLGAEGRMSSPLRTYVAGDCTPRYGGFVNWIGIARCNADSFDPEAAVDIWGKGERFGVVPIHARLAYFAGAAASPLLARSPGPHRQALLERFQSWPPLVQHALRQADDTSLHEIHVHDHDPKNTWHRGNVLLLGDAAHAPLPTSGQGACQALEDAHCIDQLLRAGVSLDPAQFFRQFTELRRDKANAIIQTGRRFAASVFTTDEAEVVKRNQQSRRSDFGQAAAAMAALWGRGLAP